MIELLNTGAYLVNGIDIIPDTEEGRAELKARTGAVPCPADAAKETIAFINIFTSARIVTFSFACPASTGKI